MPKKVLIIEDEAITANSIKSILSSKGFEITAIVCTLQDTLDSFSKDLPDLALIDIGLKGDTDGVSIAKAIKRKYPIPIVFVTKQLDEDTFLNAKEAFPKNYITKPFTDSALLRAVELALLDNSEKEGHEAGTSINKGIFILTTGNVHKRLEEDNILCIEAKSTSCCIHYDNNSKLESYTVSASSNNVVEQIRTRLLIRVHKSYYINISKIHSIQDHLALLYVLQKPIPVGRAYRKALYEEHLHFLKTKPLQKK